MKGAIQGKKGLWEDSGESGHKMFVLRGDTNIGQDQGEGGTTAQGVQGPVMMVSLCMVQKPHKWCAGDRRGQKWSPRSRRVSQDKATLQRRDEHVLKRRAAMVLTIDRPIRMDEQD